MTNSTNKPTSLFWIISTLALLWYLAGVMAYIGQAYMTDEAFNLLADDMQAYYNNLPAWVTAAFAIAVFAGALACIALVIKKKWATSLFILSLLAVIAHFIYNFFMQDAISIIGVGLIMPIATIIIAFFMVWYARKSAANGWLS